MNYAFQLCEKVKDGYSLTFEDAFKLWDEDLDILLKASQDIKEYFCGSRVDLCSIMNAKCGSCSEDCKYCAQSAHYSTGITSYPLVSYEQIIELVKENEREGVHRFSLVTSGRGLEGKDFEKVANYYKNLSEESTLGLCASIGIISRKQLAELKDSGVQMYHHNLETSRRYYNNICSTHSYDDRIETIEAAKSVGLKICSGGIIGMGETLVDRINMALELKELEATSIPINILMPVKGTPLEGLAPLTEDEILKTMSIFRFINPQASIRLAAGRNQLTNNGEAALKFCANATITGNYLTTCGNKIKDDIRLIESLGLNV
ncbi:biotin synthase [Clostridium polyendosporum]|uniref:Biotin synthase n=1 Tax=Clostridium polyendosporum TaxID=69208 RepID=A0A919S118_9CLOT|nr:biotin synthase BioB [Clostridium polyendosporum]GIM29321.1 biotin synthase [Clostridium polyendosporum]